MTRFIHEDGTQAVECVARERFGEDVTNVIIGSYMGHAELHSLDHVPDVEMATLDVLAALVMFRVVREVTRAYIVSVSV